MRVRECNDEVIHPSSATGLARILEGSFAQSCFELPSRQAPVHAATSSDKLSVSASLQHTTRRVVDVCDVEERVRVATAPNTRLLSRRGNLPCGAPANDEEPQSLRSLLFNWTGTQCLVAIGDVYTHIELH